MQAPRVTLVAAFGVGALAGCGGAREAISPSTLTRPNAAKPFPKKLDCSFPLGVTITTCYPAGTPAAKQLDGVSAYLLRRVLPPGEHVWVVAVASANYRGETLKPIDPPTDLICVHLRVGLRCSVDSLGLPKGRSATYEQYP